jgi:hypothetical protein
MSKGDRNYVTLLLLLLLSPVCRVFTLIYLKQIIFLGCKCRSYYARTVNGAYNAVFNIKLFYASTLAISEVCVLCAI